MDLRLDVNVAKGLRSHSQIARRVTEDWASRNLFCLSCEASHLVTEAPQHPGPGLFLLNLWGALSA